MEDGITPILTFSDADVRGQGEDGDVPPYFIEDKDGNPLWYLEQSRWTMRNREWHEQQED